MYYIINELVQYDILLETIFLNISVIILYYIVRLLTANSRMFKLYYGGNKLIFNEIMMRFALNWANTDFYSASILKQHSGLLGHIFPIPNQPVFAISAQ